MTFAGATTALAAQGDRRGSADPSAPVRPTIDPVLWEPEQIFPLALSHASDLKLTDEQRAQIETINSKLRASNAPLFISIDTLKPARVQLPQPGSSSAPTPIPPPPTSEEIAEVVARRHALGEARARVHENIRLSRDQMTQLLSAEQQTKLASLEDSARSTAERGDRGGTTTEHNLTGSQRNTGRRGQGRPPT
ncbi:MAG: Spy/CpxP family protein refolding chaperone [Gemmatimonadaceae bacterium]|nr:Spy/CpxP family protein refolding chaperone [Gemmatimonadaceae bacterium]